MEFLYYESGVFSSTLNIDENYSIQHNETNLKLPIDTVGKILLETRNLNWEERAQINLLSGYHFQKYKEVSKNIWIYAMMNTNKPVDVMIENNHVIAFLFHEGVNSAYLIKTGYESITPLSPWHSSHISQEHTGSYFIRMRDGTHLATDVWLPIMNNKNMQIPTILIRTPYGKLEHAVDKLRFVRRGFALVSQDVRGREDSEGEWMPMYHEKDDIDDTLNWIASQDWSNGNVGMIGSSYVLFNGPQLQAVIHI